MPADSAKKSPLNSSASQRKAAARTEAEALIQRLRDAPPQSAAATQQSALAAHALALRAGNRVLEAEALLLLGRALQPTIEPLRTLQALQQARRIFEANQLREPAALSQVGHAMALYELGQERQAIAAAQAAIANPDLPAADRAGAFLVAALAHGHLGEVDTALELLNEQALPLAAGRPWLLARLRWARVRTLWHVLLHYRAPGLWRGLPVEPGLIQVRTALPDRAALLAELREAQAMLPAGTRWVYLDIMRVLIQGISGQPGAAAQAAQSLLEIHHELAVTDPAPAAWALLCRAMMLLESGAPQEALKAVAQAQQIAAPAHMQGLLRDLLLIQSRAHEALHDSRQALASYKHFLVLQLKSANLGHAGSGSQTPEPALPPALRNLEAPHVRKALRYIEAHLRGPLAVADVVAQAGVARRTLETAFKDNKGCTIASYIKQRRLELAAVALSRTNQPLRELALSLGFGSAARFAQDFGARYGVPPSVWRRRAADSEGESGAGGD